MASRKKKNLFVDKTKEFMNPFANRCTADAYAERNSTSLFSVLNSSSSRWTSILSQGN